MEANKITQILQWVIRVCLAAVLVVPLLVHSTFFFPFITPKNLAFRLLVELAIFAYAALAVLDARYRPRLDALTKLVLGYAVIAFVAGWFGLNFTRSLWGNYERMAGILHQLHLSAYFFILVQTVRDKRAWHSLLTFSAFVSVIMAIIAWAQYMQAPFILASSGGARLAGSVGNPTFLSAYLFFHLFFLLYFLARQQRFDLAVFGWSFAGFNVYLITAQLFSSLFDQANWGIFNIFKLGILSSAVAAPSVFYPYLLLQLALLAAWWYRDKSVVVRAFLGFLLVFELFIFYQTQTRGAMLGFWGAGVLLFVYAALNRRIGWRTRRLGQIGIALAVLFPMVLLLARDVVWLDRFPTLHRIVNISATDITSQARLYTWRASWQGWTENPKTFLLGDGPENYSTGFNKHFPPEIFRDPGSQIWFDRAHNLFFDQVLTVGLLGLLAYAAIIGYAAWLFSRTRQLGWGLSGSWLWVGLLVGYVFQNMFVFDTLNTEILLYLVLGFGAFAGLQRNPAPRLAQTTQLPVPPVVVPLVSGLLAIGVVYTMVVQPVQANQLLYQAITKQNQNATVSTPLDYFRASLATSVLGRYEAREQLGTYAVGLITSGTQDTDYLRAVVEFTEAQLKQSIREEPDNVRNYLWLANLYNAMGRTQPEFAGQAKELLTQAIPLSATRPQIFFARGESALLLNDSESALADFIHAVDLAPWVADSHLRLFTLYVVLDNQPAADRELALTRQNQWNTLSTGDYSRIIGIYARTQKYDKLLEIYQQKISEEPRAAGNYLGLAQVYFKLGKTTEALQTLERAEELDPKAHDAAEQIRAQANGTTTNQ